ncbi:hypothetical protein TPL01_27840 [Sulfuriferula plumbiphila]|uniref:Outer membrane protein beta-barrel domain-containing protein n=1 Tax=Sulfuriferula plumbiphila TaxID=171865 RepID=A0A512LAZ8_9PROT|nr:DUF2860 family protein [Sulfuriferula plumbiphila]BBP03932.1 hypothetical protein SFPGR_13540 [Sulfuriferula plumbiphila]GEP31646.1 hypothetical protein TPL01_27840 [Sulfuriferula plumbiphila]
MRFNPLPAMVSAAVLAGGLAGPAQADFTVNAGAKLSYESNVNGSPDSPTKANQHSDNYGTLSASAVYYTPLDAAQTRYFIGQIGALSSTYNKFNNLDNTMLVTSAGLYQQLSPTWSGLATARGFTRDAKQNERDSNGFGGTLEIKSQLSQTVWIKGVVDYEDSKANLGAYSYTGETYGVNLGYLPLQDTFVNLGYSHATRDFKTTSPFNTTAQTLYTDVTQRIAKNWYLNGGYAYQDNKSNIAGTAYTDNIVSIGVNYSY